MERKLDGWRFVAINGEHGVKWVGGRNGKIYSSPALLAAEAAISATPVGTGLDGELVPVTSDGVELKSPAVSTFLANPRLGRLVYVVFDCLQLGEADITRAPLTVRKYAIERLSGNLERDGSVIVSLGQELDWDVYQSWLDGGSEGCVVKRKSSPYTTTRSRDWLKLKPQETCDAVITGYEMGRGEHNRDLPGAFNVSLIGSGVMTTVKIPDDDTVLSVQRDFSRWEGRLIEIRHHGLFEDGKPRHPVMVRTRQDLEVCT